MEKELEQAVRLRSEGRLNESNEQLVRLAEQHPDDARINFQCAWSFDVLGQEAAAVPYYERAIAAGLPDEDLKRALLGLGSTYRSLGDYEKSAAVFNRGAEVFPEDRALQVFRAMTLYNLGEHARAMELLLRNLADTTSDGGIRSYGQAIRFYSDKLDTIWK
ncbi:tetratricopeptide repeat protein [Bhargavaea cecembensis]|uniref:tetratricopeptide repeat protein n=1 Tax=Bhargavaea cecembensis TaxID=394098 RepID=UPI00058FF9A5|nr:tetratricopeptide repeat protein [Bhargavaea cecembensis]